MSDNQTRYAMHLEDGAPSCARAVIERRQQAGRLMLAPVTYIIRQPWVHEYEGSWHNMSQDERRHHEDALHNWDNEGGCNG